MTHYEKVVGPSEAKPRQIDASLRKFWEPQQVTKKALPTTARITILIALKCGRRIFFRNFSFNFLWQSEFIIDACNKFYVYN